MPRPPLPGTGSGGPATRARRNFSSKGSTCHTNWAVRGEQSWRQTPHGQPARGAAHEQPDEQDRAGWS